MIAWGIDVGGSSAKLVAVENGHVIWQTQSASYARPERRELVKVLRAASNGQFQKGGTVGMCVPGLRDRGSNVVKHSVNLPVLNGMDLEELVGETVGKNVTHVEVCNDATASAYDLYATRKLKGRLLTLALGTGVGAAVLDDGVPLFVEGESPGHIGQIDVSIEGEPVIGPDGGAGSLEGDIGAPALVKKYGSDIAANLKNFTADSPPLRALARAIRICHPMYLPNHIALAGGIGMRMKHLLPTLRELVEKDLTSVSKSNWTLFCGDDEC